MENLSPVASGKPDHDISVSRAAEPLDEEPDESQISKWLLSALDMLQLESKEISVRIVGPDEIAQLNVDYRNRENPTNVLSFPSNIEVDGREMLGDIVICNEIVRDEAASFNLEFAHRYAHMLVHGMLHLLGYDHINESDRQTMEALEKKLLAGMGMPDPYVADTGGFA